MQMTSPGWELTPGVQGHDDSSVDVRDLSVPVSDPRKSLTHRHGSDSTASKRSVSHRSLATRSVDDPHLGTGSAPPTTQLDNTAGAPLEMLACGSALCPELPLMTLQRGLARTEHTAGGSM